MPDIHRNLERFLRSRENSSILSTSEWAALARFRPSNEYLPTECTIARHQFYTRAPGAEHAPINSRSQARFAARFLTRCGKRCCATRSSIFSPSLPPSAIFHREPATPGRWIYIGITPRDTFASRFWFWIKMDERVIWKCWCRIWTPVSPFVTMWVF